MQLKCSILGLLILFTLGSFSCHQHEWSHDLKISDNGHYLVNRDGTPFYWIGDTGWAIFQMLTREEVDLYLDNRKEKGFTLIQAVIYWYPHGGIDPVGPHNETNAYGHRPFVGPADAPETSQPLEIEGGNAMHPNDYWDHADYIVEAVKKRGLILTLLPCWGNAFINNRMEGSQIEFTEDEAHAYGQFLGKRYGEEPHIIWCLGGDVDPVNFGDKDQRNVYRVMAEGIGRGASGNPTLKWDEPHDDWNKTLMTFHAVQAPYLSGEGKEGGSSSIWFHTDPWLDLNMMETFKWMHKIHSYVTEDYQKSPVKPTVMGEGAYEIGKYQNDCGFITPIKVRRQGYHAFFAGATGYTYGHWSIWPFRGAYCDVRWQEAMDYPGASQVGLVMKGFIEQQSIFEFVPDQSLIVSENPEGELVQCAMIKNDHSKLLAYLPDFGEIQIDLSKLRGEGNYKAIWLDPRNGSISEAQINAKNDFIPPAHYEDAILIVEKKPKT